MRVLSFVHDSVVDGEGLRSVIFLSGCPHRCEGCHNPQSWNMRAGEVLSVEEAAAELLSNPLTDVTLSGGEPFMQAREVKRLACILREAGRHIWAYTGYTLEYIQQNGTVDMNELLTYIDVLVDGPFLQERRRPELRYRGSDNQRIWKLSHGNPDGLFLM
ncbi:anaerobic ribonucleoside-triphosphate reductase activating protein [Paenibacillus assamensis]|uniref:anaerobic ribonucleoside-triphosphate reductase activating protein n=1 Tax=Paenibacillus assamensis TaxID=311244 RepID=UPI00055F0D4F|nr:anaerobic ribonucleoside-triphosphate reductase activating protein [Paenibacillus assamensis]